MIIQDVVRTMHAGEGLVAVPDRWAPAASNALVTIDICGGSQALMYILCNERQLR